MSPLPVPVLSWLGCCNEARGERMAVALMLLQVLLVCSGRQRGWCSEAAAVGVEGGGKENENRAKGWWKGQRRHS